MVEAATTEAATKPGTTNARVNARRTDGPFPRIRAVYGGSTRNSRDSCVVLALLSGGGATLTVPRELEPAVFVVIALMLAILASVVVVSATGGPTQPRHPI